MGELSLWQLLVVWAPPAILAITVHEAAHGFVANRLGDGTARLLGRLSLNPVRHVDPLGTLLIPGVLLALGAPFIFGWAKPVPVDPRNFRRPVRDMAVVAAAGPLSNLAMALAWGIAAKLAVTVFSGLPWVAMPLYLMGTAGVLVNLVLMAINLIPVPPLDGGRVLMGMLPTRAAMQFSRIEPYGLFILVALLATGSLGAIIGPLVWGGRQLIYTVLGLGG